MKDYGLDVLEQYEIEVSGARKVRGAVLCDTKQGVLLLKELTISEKRIPALYKIGIHLLESGYERVDMIVQNREGELVSTAPDGTKYIVKRWFYGRECESTKESDLIAGAQNLAGLHRKLCKIADIEWEQFGENDLREEYRRHNREMKKVRSFVRTKPAKGDFELVFLKYFDSMYAQAEQAEQRLLSSDYEALCKKSEMDRTIVHGDYNYHNILMTQNGVATTNFDRCHPDIQLSDVYYYLRKSMEKCGWNEAAAGRILKAYQEIKPLSEKEMEHLAIRLAYPEKFWKIVNTYYRSNKAWIPGKNIEKLKTAIMQTEKKKQFLAHLFAFQL